MILAYIAMRMIEHDVMKTNLCCDHIYDQNRFKLEELAVVAKE